MKDDSRIIAIGDIHGCIHALHSLIELIDPQPQDILVPLGDFIDNGRDSCNVIEELIALSSRCQLVPIMGNHEEMLLESLDKESARESWLMAGGWDTLNSYRFGASMDVIPNDHIRFLRGCRGYHECNTHIFTHANVDPALPMAQQPDYLLRWALLEEPYPGPHISGKTVVVGHTEQLSSELLDLGHIVCIDTACWRYGWLTAIDVVGGQTWQVSRWGVSRNEFNDAS